MNKSAIHSSLQKGFIMEIDLISLVKTQGFEHFADKFGTESQCHELLFQLRWPDGFRCPSCGCAKHCTLKTRPLYQCNHCHRQQSLISGTIFQGTKLPLKDWFKAAYFLAHQKKLSALSLMHELKVSYDTARRVKRKLIKQHQLTTEKAKTAHRVNHLPIITTPL